MASFFDILQQTTQQPPATTEEVHPLQASLERIAKARSGKATASVGPRASNIGEQAVIEQAQTAGQQQKLQQNLAQLGQAQQQQQAQEQLDLQQSQQQAKLQEATAGLAQQEALSSAKQQQELQLTQNRMATDAALRTEAITNKAANALKQLTADQGIQLDNIFHKMKQSGLDINDQRDAAKLESMAFAAALADKQYMNQINQIARERNLLDKAAFDREVMNVTFGSDLDKLLTSLDLKKFLGKSERELKTALNNMSMDEAREIARANTKADAVRSGLEAGVGILNYALSSKKPVEGEK